VLKKLALIIAIACICHMARAEEPQSAKTAFQNYITSVEKRVEAQNTSSENFLWLDQDSQRRESAHNSQILIQQIDAPKIDGGTVEDWIGGAFIPGATLDQVIKIDQDYAHSPTYYAPEIQQAKLLSHNGNHFQVFYRLKKHKVVTVVLDTTHDIDFLPLAKDRYAVRSHSTSVREVKSAGESDENILPEGEGLGFLWNMNSYWRVEQRDGGVYIECEVVTLARSIPLGLGALIRSTIESFASESLTNTLKAKQHAVLASAK